MRGGRPFLSWRQTMHIQHTPSAVKSAWTRLLHAPEQHYVELRKLIQTINPANIPPDQTPTQCGGSIGKHDWLVCEHEEGIAMWVDDRLIGFRTMPVDAITYAVSIIYRLMANGDHRLNDMPSGYLPPKQALVDC